MCDFINVIGFLSNLLTLFEFYEVVFRNIGVFFEPPPHSHLCGRHISRPLKGTVAIQSVIVRSGLEWWGMTHFCRLSQPARAARFQMVFLVRQCVIAMVRGTVVAGLVILIGRIAKLHPELVD